MTDLAAIRDTVTASARTYLARRGPERTSALRTAAEALLAARQSITTSSGDPDLGGRTADYRQLVADAVTSIPKAVRPRFLAAVRHHVGVLLHERYPPSELARLGLIDTPVAERARLRRAEERRQQLLLTGTDPVHTAADATLLLDIITAALRRIQVTGPDAAIAAAAEVCSSEALRVARACQTGDNPSTTRRKPLSKPNQ